MATTLARQPMSASSLIGDSIKNRQDETLGTVHEIMIDCSTGRVAYVVMSSGGFLGFGNKLFAIPMTAMELDTQDECMRLNASKEAFEESRGFDKDNWPNMADSQWETSTHAHFEAPHYWEV
ncbi:PRC-barrel domain-containing protein [Thalassoglobus sp. JC818]|uniref:PRC-barrel domain-containing protein n=1 Tax=Thalassoglobus sp. JC818 TaxID=3232136 RepID=UPI0034592065